MVEPSAELENKVASLTILENTDEVVATESPLSDERFIPESVLQFVPQKD